MGSDLLLQDLLHDIEKFGPPIMWRYTHGAWIRIKADNVLVDKDTGRYLHFYRDNAKMMEILLEHELLTITPKERPDNVVVDNCKGCYDLNGFEIHWL